MSVIVRPVSVRDADWWHTARNALYAVPGRPQDDPDREEVDRYFAEPPEWICLIALAEGDAPVGFCEVGKRSYAEGCSSSPVAYVEGIWVDPLARRSRIGRALAAAAEAWARQRGLSEIASDCALDNEVSLAFHIALGFAEVERVICFRKELDAPGS